MFEEPVIDLRKRRADSLTAYVMRIIGPHIPDRSYFESLARIRDRFYEDGVEVLTDADREKAGLSPRGGYGWTAEEIRILEYSRLMAMCSPWPYIFEVPTKPRDEQPAKPQQPGPKPRP